jgi:hypothetical protein
MKPSNAAIVSAFCAGSLVAFLANKLPERLEPALYWSMPVFHKIFPPWTSGPNPKAAGCALMADAIILTVLLFSVLRGKRKRGAKRADF